MTQEVFLRVFRSLRRAGTRPGRCKPWVMGIAVNRCRTWLAQRARRPELVDYLHDTLAGQPADDSGELWPRSAPRWTSCAPEYRTVFVLFHEQGQPYEEIAQALDRPVGTIKTWLHRARLEILDRLRQRGMVATTEAECGHDENERSGGEGDELPGLGRPAAAAPRRRGADAGAASSTCSTAPHCAADGPAVRRLLAGVAAAAPPAPPPGLTDRLAADAAVRGTPAASAARVRWRVGVAPRLAGRRGAAARRRPVVVVGRPRDAGPVAERPVSPPTEPRRPPPLRDSVAQAGDAVAVAHQRAPPATPLDRTATLLPSMKQSAEPLAATARPGRAAPRAAVARGGRRRLDGPGPGGRLRPPGRRPVPARPARGGGAKPADNDRLSSHPPPNARPMHGPGRDPSAMLASLCSPLALACSPSSPWLGAGAAAAARRAAALRPRRCRLLPGRAGSARQVGRRCWRRRSAQAFAQVAAGRGDRSAAEWKQLARRREVSEEAPRRRLGRDPRRPAGRRLRASPTAPARRTSRSRSRGCSCSAPARPSRSPTSSASSTPCRSRAAS